MWFYIRLVYYIYIYLFTLEVYVIALEVLALNFVVQ